jgi:hypothetical protein
LEGQQSVDVVSENHLAGHMADYPLIVIAECDYLEPAFKKELIAYVQNGGNLLILGPQAAGMFAAELGVVLNGTPQSEPRYLKHDKALIATQDVWQAGILDARVQIFGSIHAANDAASAAQPAATIMRLGKGKIAATWFSFSRGYLGNHSPISRAFLNDLVGQLFSAPLVEVKGSPDVDVSVNRIRGKLAINLVNTAGPHADINKPIHDSIPVVGPLEITIRTANKPAAITVEPGGQALPFEYQDGKARMTLPKLEIHSVIVVDEK